MQIKPMLASAVEDVSQINFPVIASPKMDGIRCLIHNGVAMSRKLKPIPNRFIQEKLKGLPEGLDGELMVNGEDFSGVQSAVMSEDGEPDFIYVAFDIIENKPYTERMKTLNSILEKLPDDNIYVFGCPSYTIEDVDMLKFLEDRVLDDGMEGLMIRSPDSPYKFGRSTVKEGYLLKLKRFKDDEAIVVGFEERMHNANEAEKDELGNTKRSSKKAGLQAAGTLGALRVSWQGLLLSIGTGFDDAQRRYIWDNQGEYLGKLIKFKYQEIGSKGAPRFPVFLGFRDPLDLD